MTIEVEEEAIESEEQMKEKERIFLKYFVVDF